MKNDCLNLIKGVFEGVKKRDDKSSTYSTIGSVDEGEAARD